LVSFFTSSRVVFSGKKTKKDGGKKESYPSPSMIPPRVSATLNKSGGSHHMTDSIKDIRPTVNK
jgi:hypothetical protein